MARRRRSRKPAAGGQTRGKYDLAEIKRAAAGRWLDILTTVGRLPAAILDGRHHPCPKCGGRDRFRLVDAVAGSVLCNQCFRQANGDGLAAVQWSLGCRFPEALQLVADHLGIGRQTNGDGECESGGQRAIDDQVEWLPWNRSLAALWCLRKPPITVEALELIGARLGRYLGRYTVLGFPAWREPLASCGEPVGWVLVNTTCRGLPVFQDGEIASWVKIKTLSGSRLGWIGFAAAGTEQPGITYKCEGPPDVLALISAGLSPGESAVTNVHGCGENPAKSPWIAEWFAGRDVVVIGDNDRPGRDGATRWAKHAAATAAMVRVVELPGPVAESHGADLRDYLREHGRADLDQLVAAARKVDPGESTRVIEAPDDPHRLARVNLERYATRTGGRTLRYWQGSWWCWKNSRYVAMSEDDLRAKITASVKEEFDRLNIDDQRAFREREEAGQVEEGERPPVTRKVTRQIVGSVLNATAGMVNLSSDVELDTWLPDRKRKAYVSLANGILDMEALLRDSDTVIIPHSPNWFSSVHLPCEFDPQAQCPTWEAFLDKNLEGDHERIDCLQEWVGYLLLPDTSEQKFLILEGEGANGKSVFCAGVEAMLGQRNCSHVPFEHFNERFAKTQTLGKLVNICGDAGEIDQVAEGMIKAFTSGNTLPFDRKGLEPLQAIPTARLMIACNTLPRFRDRSQGIWRRAMVCPWRVEIPPAERIKGMDKATWWAETGELPGMLRWAILGLARLKRQGGFTESAVMGEAMAEYRMEANPARQFLMDHFEAGEQYAVLSDFVYKHYRDWAKDRGYMPLSDRQFGKEIARAFPKSKRIRKGSRGNQAYHYVGIVYQSGMIDDEDLYKARFDF